MDSSVLNDIYRFWFGGRPSPDAFDPQRIEFWMRQNDDTDRQVREGFAHCIAPAARIEWNLDTLSREQAVALVVLFDQFPRNIYRTTGEAYAYDHIARDLARRLTADGWDRFTAMERFILGLPFVHHEDMADQDYAVMVISEIVVRRPERRFDLDQAIRHRDVIQRFGRFPHRNAVLGRASTPEEEAFMRAHGRGF